MSGHEPSSHPPSGRPSCRPPVTGAGVDGSRRGGLPRGGRKGGGARCHRVGITGRGSGGSLAGDGAGPATADGVVDSQHPRTRCVRGLDLLQIVQSPGPIAATLATIQAPCAAPSPIWTAADICRRTFAPTATRCDRVPLRRQSGTTGTTRRKAPPA